jgi:hypothetical protein
MLGTELRHPAPITAVAFLPDDQSPLIGCNDGSLWRWPAPRSLHDDKKVIKAWSKVRTGLVLDHQFTLRRLSQAEWLDAQAELSTLEGGAALP